MKREPIRLWYLTTQLASIGGAERMLFKVLDGLPPSRFSVSLITLYEPGDLAERLHEKGISLYARLGKNRSDPRLFPRLYQLARKERPDIVLTTTNAISYFWSTVLRQLGLARRLVVSFHVTRYSRKHHPWFIKTRSAHVDHFVALTPQNGAFWQSELQIPSDKLCIIPNGIDTNHFVPPASGKNALRTSLGIPTEASVVGKIAYFKPVKNLSRFVSVAHKVKQQLPDAFFVLGGDGSERSNVESLIDAFGLRAAFLLPGEVRQPLIWYQAMDVFLLTSDSEALPVVLLEAASCEVPAVATAVGGVPDVIVHGETGFVAPCDAEDALADYVVQLCRDEALRRRMGSQARQRVVKEFSQEAMVRRYTELFQQIVD